MGEFISVVVEEVITALGGKIVYGCLKHSQSQSQVEKFNATLKKKIKSLISFNEDGNWSIYLKVSTRNYNTIQHSRVRVMWE